jgi:type II secretory pathway pseudopilin PulG
MSIHKTYLALVVAVAPLCGCSPHQGVVVVDRAIHFELAAMKQALEAYCVDVGHYPSAGQGLNALVANPGEPQWRGPYLTGGRQSQTSFLDQWGSPLSYEYDQAHWRIRSAGPDRVFGTTDDIVVDLVGD